MQATYEGIAGKRIVVTAGASGIGRAIVDMLAANGARIHICDIEDRLLEEFTSAHPDSGATRADVSSEADVDRLFDEAASTLGGLDALINNAGIAGPTGKIEDLNPADWRRCIDIDLTGSFLCARKAVPMLKSTGGGSIVNISSVAGKYGYPFRTPYASAKYGIIGLTETLAKELGPSEIRVNAILPGLVKGPRIEAVIRARAEETGQTYEETEAKYLEKVSLRRMVSADDIAAMIAFLLSDAGRNVSGQSIAVDANVETL
ncbi:MAG: SDR family oxidoreductase [Alphaproteobacteria bacterium]|nr:SDR family oxidoreductase [Alphaproteobacteria bacterium]